MFINEILNFKYLIGVFNRTSEILRLYETGMEWHKIITTNHS